MIHEIVTIDELEKLLKHWIEIIKAAISGIEAGLPFPSSLSRQGWDEATIEATGITRRIPFSQAMEEGSKKLRRRLEFDCLIDVYHARHLGVTPLPVIFEGVS